MRYNKRESKALDEAFAKAARHGFYIRFCEEALFYRKGLHWEYLLKENIIRMHRRVEEVISHTSCCAENMDIQKLIVELKNEDSKNNSITIHVCDGEPRMAEKLYEDIKTAWPEIEYGTK